MKIILNTGIGQSKYGEIKNILKVSWILNTLTAKTSAKSPSDTQTEKTAEPRKIFLKLNTVCPLARAVRIALRKRGINHLKVVYSKEEPVVKNNLDDEGYRVPASISFVPSAMGLIIAGEVIKDIALYSGENE